MFPPSLKFTVSYGFTKSTAFPFPCKFHPAFNTSPTVAALFPAFFTISAASFAVYGALFVIVTGFPVGVPLSVTGVPSGFFTPPGVVPSGSCTCFKLFPTFDNVVGLFCTTELSVAFTLSLGVLATGVATET